MEKRVLLKNILIELNQLPEAYLQHWYDLIHTFRKKLPVEAGDPIPAGSEDFDWDELVKEVMKSRKQNNQRRANLMEILPKDQ